MDVHVCRVQVPSAHGAAVAAAPSWFAASPCSMRLFDGHMVVFAHAVLGWQETCLCTAISPSSQRTVRLAGWRKVTRGLGLKACSHLQRCAAVNVGTHMDQSTSNTLFGRGLCSPQRSLMLVTGCCMCEEFLCQ